MTHLTPETLAASLTEEHHLHVDGMRSYAAYSRSRSL